MKTVLTGFLAIELLLWFSQASGKEPDPATTVQRGNVEEASHQEWDAAIRELSKIIRLNPEDAKAYSKRGGYLEKKGDYDKAIDDYSNAIRLDPKDAKSYYKRAVCFEAVRKYDKAIQDCTVAIRLSPDNARQYALRGLCHKMEYNDVKAMADSEEASRDDCRSTCAIVQTLTLFSGSLE